MNDIQGWINLYKPINISSFNAINKIKKKFNIKKIGHAGTLDPLAEGILPIALGKTTKLIPFITRINKVYSFVINWGTQTTTDDSAGEVIYYSEAIPDKNSINKQIKKYIGNIIQKPPKFSAVKINGIRAYSLARNEKDFETISKNVFVKKIRIIKNFSCSTLFEIECGKGFYVRSFARDIARDLGTYGHISSLERLKVGKFNKDTSILLDDLLKIGKSQSLINCVENSISMLDDILAYEIVQKDDLKNISLGKPINIDEKKLKKFSSNSLDKNLLFLSNNGDIVSFGKLIGSLFKPKKVLI